MLGGLRSMTIARQHGYNKVEKKIKMMGWFWSIYSVDEPP
jgi:hypothetical protein